MNDWLITRAQTTPHKIALIINGRRISFAAFNTLVNALAADWQNTIHPQDRIGILAENSLEAACAVFALMRLGAVLVPLNTRLTADEIQWQVEQVGCRQVVCTSQMQSVLPSLEQIQVQVISLSDKPSTPINRQVDLNTPFLIVHTSGTSGKPKGAVLTYGNVFYSAMSSAYHLGNLPDDVWLCTLPIFHVGGLSILIRACLYGITVDLRDKFSMDEVNHALTYEGITLVSLVPTMLYRLLETRKEAWSSRLRLVLLGGAAADATLILRCKELNIPLATTYGLSEAASQVATAPPDVALNKPGTVGKPLMFTQVRVINETGHDQPIGDYGEVIVSGLTVMQGYDNQPEATAKTLRDGWLYTGDVGYFDAEGDLFIIQRRSDLIVTGGENVYPAEVEAVLKSHPAIKEAVVIGLPDAEWGQQVAAVIQMKAGQSLSPEDIIAYSRANLAGYKQPRRVRFVEVWPQTASGKVQRQMLPPLFEDDV